MIRSLRRKSIGNTVILVRRIDLLPDMQRAPAAYFECRRQNQSGLAKCGFMKIWVFGQQFNLILLRKREKTFAINDREGLVQDQNIRRFNRCAGLNRWPVL